MLMTLAPSIGGCDLKKAWILAGMVLLVLQPAVCGCGAASNQPAVGSPVQEAQKIRGPIKIQLPLPSALHGVSYSQQDLYRWGKEYGDAWPNSLVSRDSVEAVFTPHAAASGTQLTDLAFATFQFQLSQFDLSPTLRFTWTKTGSLTDGWVALANFQRDRWEWFCLPESGELAFDPATSLSGAGMMYVVVLFTGDAEWRMREIAVGVENRPGDWSMYGRDARHSHCSPFTGPATNALKWSYSTSTALPSSSPAVAADGTVYIGNDIGSFYAINSDGSLQWVQSDAWGPGWIRSSPAIAPNGTVCVGISFEYMDEFGHFYDCGYVLAYHRDGSVAWYRATAGFVNSAPVIDTDGNVFVVSSRELDLGSPPLLQAFSPGGEQKWSCAIGGESDPALGIDGTVYVGSDQLYAIKPDGSLKWIYTTGSAVSAPSIAEDNTIYIGSDQLYAINPDGSLKWSYPLGSTVHSAAIGSDGTVYVCSDQLYVFTPDGSLQWSYATGGAMDSAPAIDAAGTAYVGCDDHKLYAINADASLKWTYTTGGALHSAPAIGADGTVYVGSNDSKLYAIGPGG